MAKGSKKKRTKKQPKRSAKKRTAGKSWAGWLTGIAILATTLLIFGLWLGKGSRDEEIPSLAYEEETSNNFAELVNEVELAIYQSLRELGVNESQVKFRRVLHRAQRDRQWDFTELEVTLSQDLSLSRIEEEFARNLGSLGGQVTLESSRKADKDLELQIRVGDSVTHRLALLMRPKQRKAPPATMPRVAIVIDDVGYDGRLAKQFLEIEGALSFSVLPHSTYSKSISRRVNEAGRDLLLHLPMEPKGYPEVNPGVGALLTEMTEVEIVQTLRKNFDSLSNVKGVNNHMGSKFCESEQKLIPVMKELKRRGLFFLDSRTTTGTRAYTVAQKFHVPAAERNVFLDNIQNPQAIRGQLKRLIQLARLKGGAIGIAHPHEATLTVLRVEVPKLPAKRVELVPVSQLVHN
ncbi:MAG: divergent polysaccharide deacetylase family protein [Deltaproteobacteria bacterium]|nr:divergent polysaccharide deacetylase family protein [Deltaproteobacteria bacterium]